MWSVGVVLYILLCGYAPFYDEDQRRLFDKIRRGAFCFDEDAWGEVSGEAKALISALLELDPAKRLTASQALDHPWVRVVRVVPVVVGVDRLEETGRLQPMPAQICLPQTIVDQPSYQPTTQSTIHRTNPPQDDTKLMAPLSKAQSELRRFNARRKFRAGVRSVRCVISRFLKSCWGFARALSLSSHPLQPAR